MKPETSALLLAHYVNQKFHFFASEAGLQLDHNLTDDEMKELVELEYGKTLTAPVNELFVVIMKKLARSASDKVRQDV